MSIDAVTFFSSDSRRQYIKDVLNVLALPNGSWYQFRYAERYLTPQVRELFLNQNIENCKILIAFRSTTEGGKEGAFIVPVRWARIVSVEQVSDFFLVRFKICGYPRIQNDYLCRRKEEIEDRGRRFLKGINENNRAMPVHAEIPSCVDPKSIDDAGEWIHIIKELSKFEYFSQKHFIRVKGLINAKNGSAAQINHAGEFVVNEGGHYDIEIEYFSENYFENDSVLKINCDPQIIKGASPSIVDIDGRYDQIKFVFDALEVERTTKTDIVIKYEQESMKDNITNLSIHMEVVNKLLKEYIKYAITGVGGICAAMPGIIADAVPLYTKVIFAIVGSVLLVFGTKKK